MEVIHSIKVSGRACCAIHDEVWVAKQAGDIVVFSARSGDFLQDVEVKGNGTESAQVVRMAAVFDEIWVATNNGIVHVYNARRHTCVETLILPGAERKVPVVELCFNGQTVVIATGSGSLYVHHPLSHKRVGTLSTSAAPCTAATVLHNFIVGGDAKGGLYVWNPHSAECLTYHGGSTSEVVALLHEPSTGTVWVSRANENTDVYAFGADGLTLQRRVSGLGKVTGMSAVSATVVATTFTKRVVQIDAATAKVMMTSQDSPTAVSSPQHTSFIHGCCKPMHQEVAQLWTVGNDGAIHVWRVTGKQVPAVTVPMLSPAVHAALTTSFQTSTMLGESKLRLEVQTEKQRRVDMVEDLRKAREEAHELRLRLAKKEESCHTVEEELNAEKKLRRALEERIEKLTKDVTDITSKVNMVERERSTLQSEATQLKADLSKANTSVNTKQIEKSTAEQQLSQEKANKSVLEQRLRDTEAKLTTLQAEHRRLCDSVGSAVNTSSLSKEAQDNLIKDSAALMNERDQARKLNQLLSSAVASMEYTIRRREEEDKDLAALLNAYRRRVADRISDPHLSALLLGTIVRNAPRFDLECDPFTKAQLMERNGPFLQFIQSLRATDPDTYEKLMQYLQNPAASENLNADTHVLLDRLVALASKEGEVSGEDMASFRRSIPGLVDGPSARSVLAAAAGEQASTGGAAASSFASLLQNNLTSSTKSGTGEGGAPNSTADGGLRRSDLEVVNSAVSRELRGQQLVDESYIREQQTMFEFILKTRRLLVESLALLHKRTVSARNVVEALGVSTGTATSSVQAALTPRKSQQPLQKVFGDIIRELEDLVTDVVQHYLTAAEKQRLGIAQ